jgi:DNA-binding GntR family transcriptional regulator
MKQKSPPAGKHEPRSTLRSELVSKILNAIFSGEIPGGGRLIEEEVADRLGVSRTPVREALGELASIGVIVLRPNHGAMVRPFGPEQLKEIYHVRRILETEATRLAAQHVDAEAVKTIREETQRLLASNDRSDRWTETALALDQRFHELISRSSGSARLAEEIGKYRNMVVAVGNAVGNKLHAHDQNMREHTAVMDLMLAGKADEAGAAMAKHIERGADTAAQWLRQVYESHERAAAASRA